MPLLRSIHLVCPYCGNECFYRLEPSEHAPLVTLVTCDQEKTRGCGLPFAVEVHLRVEISAATCRLALPVTTKPDALAEIETMPEPDEDIAY